MLPLACFDFPRFATQIILIVLSRITNHFIMLLVIVWLLCSFGIGRLCVNKKVGFWGGFVIAAIFSPIVGLLVYFVGADADVE